MKKSWQEILREKVREAIAKQREEGAAVRRPSENVPTMVVR
jgi:hypothetical protein